MQTLDELRISAPTITEGPEPSPIQPTLRPVQQLCLPPVTPESLRNMREKLTRKRDEQRITDSIHREREEEYNRLFADVPVEKLTPEELRIHGKRQDIALRTRVCPSCAGKLMLDYDPEFEIWTWVCKRDTTHVFHRTAYDNW